MVSAQRMVQSEEFTGLVAGKLTPRVLQVTSITRSMQLHKIQQDSLLA
jgi:hypothetical protein